MYPTGIKKPSSYCHRELDLTILVDESSSIEKDEWDKLIPFLKSLIKSINISPNYVHLSLVTFSTSIRWLISYLDPASKNESLALEKVDLLSRSKPVIGFTFTGQALNFIKEAVYLFGSRRNAPKAIILITDGASTQPNVTSQASAMLRDQGVTLLVVGVGLARSYECRAVAGCPIQGDCPWYFKTNWDDIIRKVGELMTEVCETIPQDAVCNPHWSDWSPCSSNCGPGTKKRKLMGITTVAEPTIGTNGKSGRTCEEQFKDVEIPTEECEGPCIEKPEPPVQDIEGGGKNDSDSAEGGDDEGNSDRIDDNDNEEDKPEYHPDDDNNHDDNDNHDDDVPELPKHDYEEPENDGDVYPKSHEDEPERPTNYEEPIPDIIQESPHEKDTRYINNENYTKHEKTHEEKQEEKSTKKEEFKKNGAKIAGGILLAVIMLGAGGGYAFYKKKTPVTDLESNNDENFSEARLIPSSQEGETYTVPDLDDGLWSESH